MGRGVPPICLEAGYGQVKFAPTDVRRLLGQKWPTSPVAAVRQTALIDREWTFRRKGTVVSLSGVAGLFSRRPADLLQNGLRAGREDITSHSTTAKSGLADPMLSRSRLAMGRKPGKSDCRHPGASGR